MEVDRFRAFSHASVMRPKPGDQGKKTFAQPRQRRIDGLGVCFPGEAEQSQSYCEEVGGLAPLKYSH